MKRWARAVLGMVLVTGLTACRGDEAEALDPDAVEAQIRAAFADDDVLVEDVTCPGGRDVEEGDEFECRATLGRGEELAVEVRQAGGGDVAFDLPESGGSEPEFADAFELRDALIAAGTGAEGTPGDHFGLPALWEEEFGLVPVPADEPPAAMTEVSVTTTTPDPGADPGPENPYVVFFAVNDAESCGAGGLYGYPTPTESTTIGWPLASDSCAASTAARRTTESPSSPFG